MNERIEKRDIITELNELLDVLSPFLSSKDVAIARVVIKGLNFIRVFPESAKELDILSLLSFIDLKEVKENIKLFRVKKEDEEKEEVKENKAFILTQNKEIPKVKIPSLCLHINVLI